jgi:hypothetical protein
VSTRAHILTILLAVMVGVSPLWAYGSGHGPLQPGENPSRGHVHVHAHEHSHGGWSHTHVHHHDHGTGTDEDPDHHHGIIDHGDDNGKIAWRAPRGSGSAAPPIAPIPAALLSSSVGDWQPRRRAKPPPDLVYQFQYPHFTRTVILLV